MALIEQITADGSQPWQGETSTANDYNGYKFNTKIKGWQHCEIKGDTSTLHYFGQNAINLPTSVVCAYWSDINHRWEYTEKFLRIDPSTRQWIKLVNVRSITHDSQKKLTPLLRTEDTILTGHEAVLYFQDIFKLLNSKERRIDTALRLFPNENKETLFNFDKQGNITGVSVNKYLLFNQYLIDVVSGYHDNTGTYIPPLTEFSTYIEYHLPQSGLFKNKRGRRNK